VATRGGRTDLTLFLTTGLCGGFTTMSAFSFDTVLLVQQGHAGFAVLNLVATIGTCLAAVWLGLLAGTSN
jgi:CrcB protein